MENGDIQELADFAMTCFYSPEEDLGLVYDWDALIEVLKRLPMSFDPEYYVLGLSLERKDFALDPGGMGTGFIAAEDISNMHDELVGLKKDFSNNVLPLPQDVLVALTRI